ncbi:NAD(P)H-dependent oxidoreductase subunit E [Stappia sp. F7233]|uniref:NAD(P)H-dependent oxidoreductase subunit E n=1 Tax=Stappia albiluteola TaxID=2758565 RepID=A0A839AIZ2_9HYPH|nr:NAD(P)H-dependent oxidoreductase subunit E [Stappia albiluteola]MBA5779115.1 NAD(P)H-dependent oxidoreductase subunit E [Stappia albiluteola]
MLGGSRADLTKKSARPKGRPLDEDALQDVRDTLGNAPRRRDLLIEHLHKVQDRFGHLSAAHLKALAEEMRMSQAEVYEVASFYHHFDIVKEGKPAPAPVTIRVCESLSCMLAGAEQLIASLESGFDTNDVRIVRAPCQGRCAEAPSACVGRREIGHSTFEKIEEAVSAGATRPELPDYLGFDAYVAEGGYQSLRDCLSGERQVDDVIERLSASGLRGLGGAGFPSGRKWQIVRSYPGPRLMTVNGDEGEPGTFKDRHYLERDPHRMLEGALIAAWAVEAERIYIYMRDEYPAVLEILHREIARLEEAGLTKHAAIEIRRGAGAYICGEESAMIESIEGKRGLPRHRPPYIAENGLFGRPTLNHNVETLYWVRTILEKGADWFADQGKEGHKGLRSFSVSGRVASPGVRLLPAGTTIRELIEACGGMAEGHSFRAFLPGGASGGIFPASMADLPLDFGTFEKFGGFVGSHAVVILSDKDDLKAAALNLMNFFKHESCGQCTPCRVGTEKMVALLEADDWDEVLIGDLEAVMRDASICGLGQAAANPVRSVINILAKEAGQ